MKPKSRESLVFWKKLKERWRENARAEKNYERADQLTAELEQIKQELKLLDMRTASLKKRGYIIPESYHRRYDPTRSTPEGV